MCRIGVWMKIKNLHIMKKLYGLLLVAAMLLPFVGKAQGVSYTCNFEDPYDSAGWVFVNGSQSNKWYIGTDSVNVGSRALFVSNVDSSTNVYSNSVTSITYAYREFELSMGGYFVSYNWRAYGEGSYDYLRVFLVPSSVTITAGLLPDGTTATYNFSTAPAGWIPLDGNSRLNLSTAWQYYECEFNITTADTYKLVFMWCNDPSAGTNPPAAVDNIVFTQPTCPTPALPYVENLTTTSFDLYWSDMTGGNAGEWLVEIDSATQAHGMGTVYSALDTSITFSGLTPNTMYTLWIMAVCAGSDTSMALRYQVRTPCTFLTTLPYYQNFETTPTGGNTSTNFVDCWNRINDGTTYFGYPYVSSSTSYSHNGGSRGLYWYNTTSVGTYGSYQCIALPGIDTDYMQMRNIQLSFWGKATSTSYRPVLEVGLMTNPNDITTFTSFATVNIVSTDWDQFVVDFSDYHGPANFIAVRALSTTGSWYAALDEFIIERKPACPNVHHLAVSNTGTTGMLLTWDMRGGDSLANTYQVRVDSVGSAPSAGGSSSSALNFTTTTRRCLVTGLVPDVTYKAWVRAVCVNDSLGGWDSIVFSTHAMPCGTVDVSITDTVVFSTGTTQTSGVPVNSSWGNTLCQSIYTASELVAMGLTAGAITGVDYTFTNNSSYEKLFSIYISMTDRSNYSGTGDMLPVRASNLVYGPTTHSLNTSGTVHYEFTTPFMWDGTSNIVITTMMNQPNGTSHSISSFYGYSTNCGVTRTNYRYQDGTQYTPSNTTSGNAGTSNYRPSITFYTYGCAVRAECAAPTIIVERVEADTVEVSWIPGYQETSWNVLLKDVDSTNWTTIASGVGTNQYTLTTVQPMKTYQLRIVPNCGGDSVYDQAEFTTPCVPLTTLPFMENFENFTASSASGSPITDCWHRGNSFSSSGYPYVTTSYANSGMRSLYFYNSGTATHTYLALPAMSMSIDSLQVSFAAYQMSSYSIKVGVMTDPTDFNTFTEVASLSPSTTNTWEMLEVPLNSYEGTGQYITLAAYGAYSYMYIDDIEVTVIPNCPRPRNITFSGITTTNATVSWVDTNATNFEIEYGPSGFALGTGTVVTSMYQNVTLYGLNHSTQYDVYVRGICANTDTSNWSFVSSFTTECGIISLLPYSQNFSGWGVGSGARPACWACGGYSSYPYILNVTNNEQVIGQTLYMYSYASNRVYASMPELDSISYPINMVQTIFKAWSSNLTSISYSHKVIVGVCSTQGDLGTFNPVDTVALTDIPLEYEVAFDTVTSAGKYITFVSTALDGATYNYVYLDSVAIELIPDCQRPNAVTASNINATSADISWNDRAGSLQWQVECVLHGFGVGSGTRVTTATNPLTVTGLLPSTSYDVYVRSICGAGDTSQWSAPYYLVTLQNPATVPYFFDFETSVEWDNWQTASNTTINWFRDTAAGNGTNGYNTTGTHALYISADSGLTYSTNTGMIVNAVAYRDIDFGNIDSTYLLSFRAAAGGRREGNSVYDGLAVFMVEPDDPMQPSSSSPLTSPWGNINNLTPLVTVYCQPGWNTYTAIIDTLTGIHRIVFFWFNQGSGTPGTFLGGPAAIDDVSIQYMSCPRPAGIRTTNVTMASAHIVWHGLETGDYRVTLRSQATGELTYDLVHTNSINYTGLTPSTTYTVSVRRLCGENDSSMLPSINFTTLMCNDARYDTIGNPASTTTSYSIPVNNGYGYTYTQEIVLGSELSGAGEISAINFYYSGVSPITSKAGCTIYMGHTTLSSFTSEADIIDPATMSIVYMGNMNCTPGWNKIRFSSPFSYNGSSNVVIAIDDNSGNYQGYSYTFYTSPATAQMSLTMYSDIYNPDCSSLSALHSFSGSTMVYGYRNLMVLDICSPSSCVPPILREPIVRSHNVTLRWRNTGTGYNVGYRLASSSSWISSSISTTDTFYTISSLYPMTDYVYRVRQQCDTTGVSNWAEGTFNSSDVPCLSPMGLEVVNVTNNSVKLKWVPEENNIGYRLHVFNTYYDVYKTRAIAGYTLTGLDANTRYYAAVQAECQGFDDPSEWSDTISFMTDVCPDATDLVTSDVRGNSVMLDWTDGGRAIEWEIEWGLLGFDVGTGIRVTTDHHPYLLTGLTGETTYDIMVRAVCGTNFVSEHWSNRATVTTEYSGINSVSDDVRVHLFPNPTSADVELTLPATAGEVRVEVIDVAGRVHISSILPANTEKTTLATSLLAQGAYYVRVAGGDINTVKKLVVK